MAAKTIQSSKDDTHIYYELTPGHKNKNTLVMLHGLGGDLTAWNQEHDVLSKSGYPILRVDLRGHGLSGRPTEINQYRIQYFIQDILDIIDEEQLHDYVLIGHCFGGMVALALEAFYPYLSNGLILIDTSFKAPFLSTLKANPEFLSKMFSLLTAVAPSKRVEEHVGFDKKFIGTSDFSIRRLLSDIIHTSLKSYLATCKNILKFNAYELLNLICVPTLIIAGSKDHIIPLEVEKRLAARISYSELKVLRGNHILVINNPKEVTTVILKFLNRLPMYRRGKKRILLKQS